MNEETVNLANDALKSLIESATQTKDFVIDQAPDIINQLLYWKFFENLILGIIPLVLVLISLMIVLICSRDFAKNMYEDDISLKSVIFIISTVIGVGGLIGFITGGFSSLMTALQIYIAPKIFLVEYAAGLVK
jgi:hypothetical protein